MKNLLQQSLRQLTIFAFIVFTLSIPSYFFLVDWIWIKELDENNTLIAQRIENEFNEQNINPEKLDENISFWNQIQPVSTIEKTHSPLAKDSTYTIERQNPYAKKQTIDRFRVLKTTITIHQKNYILTVETNVEETEETVVYIAIVSLLFFLILVTGFWILNRRLSKKLWLPFRDTLQKLKDFQLHTQQQITFKHTNTIEFTELNTTLEKLLQHSIATYTNQKEFTENAAHEMQTPLAIIKNKLDLLLQSEDLTEKQYLIAEEINKALTRSSRINKNLLLLSKIENQQFDNSEILKFDNLLQQSITHLQPLIEDKNFLFTTNIQPGVEIKGNKGLSEVMIQNLLVNAIRYTSNGEILQIKLSKSYLEIVNFGETALKEDLLFQRFSTISTQKSGNGLGLSIVKSVCNFHHWQINYRFKDSKHIFEIEF